MTEPLAMPKARLDETIALLWPEELKVLGRVDHDGAVAFEEPST